MIITEVFIQRLVFMLIYGAIAFLIMDSGPPNGICLFGSIYDKLISSILIISSKLNRLKSNPTSLSVTIEIGIF